jgi:hypothetical protein
MAEPPLVLPQDERRRRMLAAASILASPAIALGLGALGGTEVLILLVPVLTMMLGRRAWPERSQRWLLGLGFLVVVGVVLGGVISVVAIVLVGETLVGAGLVVAVALTALAYAAGAWASYRRLWLWPLTAVLTLPFFAAMTALLSALGAQTDPIDF